MTPIKYLILTAALAAVSLYSSAATLVNDHAGIFTVRQKDSLERALVAFDDSTSNQICIYTTKDLEGQDVAQYAISLANQLGIGSSKNNGILILLKPRGADGYVDVTIQIGRGLEGAIPDVYASRIIRNIMGPHLKQDEYYEAIRLACIELMALASGEISEPRSHGDEDSPFEIAMAIITMIIVIAIFIAILNKKGGNGNIRGGNGGGPTIFINPGHRGGGFGGGGGGSFGGFGGFGGGSFGGGGASGRF